ncbi:MAG: hypothetical protein ACI9YL_000249 [Luteibaculaceae bacterium]|jgi:hypothetical protein
MHNQKTIISFLFLLLSLTQSELVACSMYKITVGDKTMVGCNEDAWRITSRIWFENANRTNEFGAAFTGSRHVSNGRTAPQSGMNEVGLTFSRLTAYYPKQNNPFLNRLSISDEVDYLSDILHKCSSIDSVKKYIEQYDHSIFIGDVFIYVDSTGKYLIVEPYKLIVGNNPNYVLSNFCPSITGNENARKLKRYKNAEDYLNTHTTNPSISFCSTLSDTMQVCRNRNGDGTLLTSIWDTKDLLVNLYFYHQFDTTVQFNLQEELYKGNHMFNIPNLFPKNSEFERLSNYKTPFNTPVIRLIMIPIAGILALFAFILGVSLLKNQKSSALFLIPGINLILSAYLFVLATNRNIFYFDAPYKHYSSSLITVFSYTPFLLLVSLFPILYFSIKLMKSETLKPWIKKLLISNHLIYLILIFGFGYWGLFQFWN